MIGQGASQAAGVKRILFIAAVAVLLLSSGPTAFGVPVAGQARGGGGAVVKATQSNSFNPATTKVRKGTKVVWKNTANHNHTVTAYGGGWSKNVTLSPGEKTSFTFKKKGTFTFLCTIHGSLYGGSCSGMCGKVVVKG